MNPKTLAVLFEAIVVGALWLLFSGKLDALHLIYGGLSVTAVLFLTGRLVGAHSEVATSGVLGRIHWARVAVYPFWLLWRIVVANLQVAGMILHPRMPIDPVLLQFDSGLEGELARVSLGNSITLTPGTFTLLIRDRQFLVHALHESACTSILDGSMPRVVAKAFGETPPEDLHVKISRKLDGLDLREDS